MRLLVRATNWVGDAILSLPALRAIRKQWPEAWISLLARPWVADLYREQDCADELILYENTGRHRGFRGQERLVRDLRLRKFDAAILLQNAFDAAWLAWRAGIPERIGYARDGRGLLLTKAIPVPAPGEIPAHESCYYLELLRRAGWLERLPPLDAITLRVGDCSQGAAEARLQAAGAHSGRFRIAMAPGAAYGSAKCWLPERYAELADALVGAGACDVIIFGAAAEMDIAGRIGRAMRRPVINLTGRTNIGELPALLKACHLFIGNDSGAMHVAAAVGLPVIGIFGPTNPEATRPLSPRFTLVREPVECSPCLLRTCPIDHRCMTGITAAQVLEIVRRQFPACLSPNSFPGAPLG